MICTGILMAFIITSCAGSKKTATTDSMAGTAARVKQLEAEGYKITGAYSTFTLYELLDRHNKKVASDWERYVPLQGTGVGSETSDARMYARNDAAIAYATEAGSVIEGGITRQFSNLSGDSRIKIMGAYTQKVQEFIMPHLKESLSVQKENNNRISVMTFFIIDETQAKNVRKDAMNQALRETGMEQVFGTAVDKWVEEFVSPRSE